MEKKERDYKIFKTLEKTLSLYTDTTFLIKELEDQALFLGILSTLISNKKIFRKNSELATFLENRFDIKFAEYCKKSRPLMLGKTIKYFLENENDFSENINTIYRILNVLLNNSKNELSWTDIIKKIDINGDI